ncbi:galacturonosyltransferase 14 [Hordeum vulgare]|nr:galacturonosyltransferase 14 [Hordeum vulgare]
MRSRPSSPPFFAAMEVSQPTNLVNMKVVHAQSRPTDLVAGHVASAVAQGTNAPARKRQGNIVMQGDNPASPAGKERVAGATVAAGSARPSAGKMSKVLGMKRKKVPTNKPSSTPFAPTRRSPTVPFNDATSTASEVFDQRAESGGLNNVAAEFVNLLDTNAIDIDQAPIAGFEYNELEGGVDEHGGED